MRKDKLWDIALSQKGYVSTFDARNIGLSSADLYDMVRLDQLVRSMPTVYHFIDYPSSDNEELMKVWLWAGTETAVISHDTMLAKYELSDILPSKTHITIPKGKRIRKSGGELIEIHKENLQSDEITWFDEVRVVTPFVAIRQCIDTLVPLHLINQAIETAEEKKMITADQKIELLKRRKDKYGV
ncbi:MAG: hypothetical protein LBM13_01340 [Candidatus Ancillula sp.]|jgi:predicted transcriptional regulator of viral defense system|nr:hypothetical protein [Candidatus Ancillula sp.]